MTTDDGVLVVEVAGQQVIISGEPLVWLARQSGYASVQELLDDPDSRARVGTESLLFAARESLNRATRRRRR